MRLATMNIASGRGLADGQVDADRLRAAIAALDVDVLALQEVDHGQPRSGGVDQAAIAAEAIGAVAGRFAATLIGTPGGDWRPAGVDSPAGVDGPAGDDGLAGDDGTAGDDGLAGDDTGTPAYGIALVSRWPVLSWTAHRWRAAPVKAPVYVPGVGWILLADEPRVLLAAVIGTPWGRVTCASCHLSFVPGWNLAELVDGLRWLRGQPGPRYLLGDLNLPATVTRAVAAASGWRLLARRPTYPAARPRVQLDHVLAHPRRRSVRVTATTPELPVSDHRALVVEVEPDAPPAG